MKSGSGKPNSGNISAEEARIRFHALAIGSSDIISVFAPDGRRLYTSPSIEGILGYKPEEIYGTDAFDLIHPDDAPTVRQKLAELERDPATEIVYEFRLRHADGSWRTFESVSANRLEEPEVGGIVCNARDITDRKRVEKGLKESEERYRRLVEFSPDAVLVHNGTKSLFVNAAAVDLFGAACAEELTGLPVMDFIHPDYRQIVRARIARTQAGEGTDLIQEKVLRLDGRPVDVEVTSTPITYEGEPASLVVARDITTRRRAEEERDRLFEFSIDLLCVAGLDGYFKRVNPAFEQTLGYSGDELLARPFVELVHPEDRAATIRQLESLGGGERLVYFENRYLCKDGSEVWLSWKAVFVAEEALIYASARDVTDRKRAEEALRRRDAILRAVAFAAERFLEHGGPWQENIQEVLKRLGVAAEASRAYIFENYAGADGATWTTQRYEWAAPGIPAQIDNPRLKAQPYRAAGLGRWEQTLSRGEALHGHVRNYPESERAGRKEQGILSQALVPIFVEGQWWGFIGFDECAAEREFSAAEVEALEAAADNLGAAIQRARAEQTLAESEERYRAVVEQSEEGIVLFDTATAEILESNAAFRELLGYTAEELPGRKIYDLIAHERSSIDANIRLILEQGSHFVGERQYRRRDERLVEVEVSANLISYGGTQAICAVIRDVTERRRKDEELRESQRTLSTLMSNLPGMAYRCANDPDWTMELVSEGCLQLTGYAPDDLIGNRRTAYAALIHPEDQDAVWTEVQTGVAERRPFQLTYRITTTAGQTRWVWEQGRGVFSTEGELLALEGFVSDVTDRLHSFRMLEERVTALAGISASLSVGQTMEVTLDSLAAGVVQSTTALACAVVLMDEEADLLRTAGSHGLPAGYTTGLQAAYWAGMRLPTVEVFRTRQPILFRNARQAALNHPLASPLHRFLHEAPWETVYCVPLVSRDKALGTLNLYYAAGQEPSEDETVFLGAVADQTAVAVENARLFAAAQDSAALEERQRLARELHDSVSQALYGIGLGARTASALLDREASTESVAEWLEYVRSLAGAGLTEMRALIFELRPESLQTEGLVAALQRQTAALQARHEMPVHATLDHEPELSQEAKEALYRIAQEALHNTVKHARASRVDLKLESDDHGIVLEVCDDGVGFDPEASFSGHLGLKSMRERATRLGGTLLVESAPGKGASVHMRVPPIE